MVVKCNDDIMNIYKYKPIRYHSLFFFCLLFIVNQKLTFQKTISSLQSAFFYVENVRENWMFEKFCKETWITFWRI